MSERRIPYPISPNHNILLKNRKKIYIEEGVKPKPSKIKKRQNKNKKWPDKRRCCSTAFRFTL